MFLQLLPSRYCIAVHVGVLGSVGFGSVGVVGSVGLGSIGVVGSVGFGTIQDSLSSDNICGTVHAAVTKALLLTGLAAKVLPSPA